MITKAQKRIPKNLDELLEKNIRLILPALARWFDFIVKQVRQDLVGFAKAKDWTDRLTDWESIEEGGKIILKPTSLKILQSAGNMSYEIFDAKNFDVLNPRAMNIADKFCADLVKDVTKETKKGIRAHIKIGIKEGKSMDKIARELRPLVGMTERQVKSIGNYRKLLAEKRPDLSVKQVNRKVSTYTNKTHRQRMMGIARTETARAQNLGYTEGLAEMGIVETELSPTAGACVTCEALQEPMRFPIEIAGDIIPVHPNCRCAMLPVMDGNVVSTPMRSMPKDLPAAFAPEKGCPSWKNYLVQHSGEKSNSAVLYDFYKVRFDATGKIAPSGLRHLKAHAAKFEATSVKISKPISGFSAAKPIPVKSPTVELVPKPKPKPKVTEGVLKESYFKETKGWEERLVVHKTDLRMRMGFDPKDVKMLDTTKMKEEVAKFKTALQSYTKPTAKVDDISRTYYPAKGEMKGPMRNLNKFFDTIEDVGCDDAIKLWNQRGVNIDVSRKGYRANAKLKDFSINMGQGDAVNIYYHELGHLMEANPITKRKALKWVKARGGGKNPVPFDSICSWHKDKQLAFKDKFIDPYVGKVYRDGATEAMSMGMQQFTSYNNMLRFAKKDFDHFAFIHGVLTGAI